MDIKKYIWETPTGQTIAESDGEIGMFCALSKFLTSKVHVDGQGFVPPLPDTHSVTFPVLAFPPPSTTESGPVRKTPESTAPSTQFARVERLFHQLLALSSIPVDLFNPFLPYATPIQQSPTSLKQSQIGRIALHPQLPIVAFSHANNGGSILLYDLRTNAYLKYKLVLESSHELNTLAFSKYNLLAAGMSSGELLIYQLNLSISASASPKTIPLPAIPSLASLLPPQFPVSSLLGEVTDVSFDQISGRYLAIATTRSGTWIYDTVSSSSVRLCRHPSAAVAFSPNENVLAVARERTGEIAFYSMIRAGTLNFSLPTISVSGAQSTVTCMQWTSDGKTLVFCNDGQEGLRILSLESPSVTPPCIYPVLHL
jgi:WD40 repeat protein